jgi:hypothetical protein
VVNSIGTLFSKCEEIFHFLPAHALGAFFGSVPQAELLQWRSHIAAKKQKQRRCMSEAPRLERKNQ